jgi:hypothetical protein
MPCKEILAVYSEDNIKHKNILCGKNAEFLNVKADDTYSNYYALKD